MCALVKLMECDRSTTNECYLLDTRRETRKLEHGRGGGTSYGHTARWLPWASVPWKALHSGCLHRNCRSDAPTPPLPGTCVSILNSAWLSGSVSSTVHWLSAMVGGSLADCAPRSPGDASGSTQGPPRRLRRVWGGGGGKAQGHGGGRVGVQGAEGSWYVTSGTTRSALKATSPGSARLEFVPPRR